MGNHHLWRNGGVEHVQTVLENISAYGTDDSDSHSTAAGNQKATSEFVPLLNTWVAQWQADGLAPGPAYLPAILGLESVVPLPPMKPVAAVRTMYTSGVGSALA